MAKFATKPNKVRVENSAQEEPMQQIEGTLSNIEQFFENNQKSITIIICGIIVAVALYLGFVNLYLKPHAEEAQSRMFVAENAFANGDFQLALDGEGSELGFLGIIDEYSVTPSANLAHYYAGISYLRLGQYELALEYLKSFDANDIIVSSIANGAIGDTYAELEDYKSALKYYQLAIDNSDNDFTAPLYMMRAAQLNEKLGDNEQAVKLYNQIITGYPNSEEGTTAQKYIARIEASK